MAIKHTHGPATRAMRTDLDFEFFKIGAERFDLTDPYHMALTAPWPHFALGLFAFYGLLNLLFAGLYLAQAGCVANLRPGSLADAFFFSIETLATVGYGEMAPATLYGHLVSSAEIVTGMSFTAIMTGLVFVRFSKPKARIVYADNVVIARHNGRPTLMMRIGNRRTTMLTNTTLSAHVLLPQTTREGQSYRQAHELRLARATAPIFPLTLTLMHEIDETSPLRGYDLHSLADSDVRILLSLEARDPGLAAMVYDLKTWRAADILFGRRFVDTVLRGGEGRIVGDLTRINLTEPDADGAAESPDPRSAAG
jgi:inward rectifier potassium channel